MSARRSLIPIVSVSLFALAAGPIALAADDASTETSDADVAKASENEADAEREKEHEAKPDKKTEEARLGAVQQALRRLYTIPRPRGGRNPTNTKAPRSAKINPNAKGAAAPHESDGVSEPNRLGLQHRDAIRESISSVPIGDDIHGSVPSGNRPHPDGELKLKNDPAITSASAHLVSPYYYSNRHLGPRVRDHRGERADRPLYAGQPDAFHGFGFVEEPPLLRFRREAYERSERLQARAQTQLSRGLTLFRNGQYRLAVSAFKLSADQDHGDPAARIYAAHALFATGRYRDAVKFLRRAFELQPKLAFLTYDLRADYGVRPDFDAQLADLEKALRRSPRNPDRLILLGYVRCYSNQRDEAYEPLARALKIKHGDKLAALLAENCQPPDVALDEIHAAPTP